MAWIADARLAAAVSEAGGLGIIAAGNAPPCWVRTEIRAAKALTAKPFGVNIMLLSPHADDVVQVALEEGVRVVTTGAGSPLKYMQGFKERGMVVIPIAPSVAFAKKMERTGADAIIAEGMEAGGHIGKLTTMAMMPQIVDAVNLPVIAAGGIGDGRGMAAAFMLGAAGVQVGTRFLLAHECNVAEEYKQAIVNAKDIDTTITGGVTGHPVRVIRNAFSRQLEEYDFIAKDQRAEAAAIVEKLGSGALKRAVDGDVAGGSVMAGQIAGMLEKRQSAAEIIDDIMRGCRETMSAVSKGW